MSNPFNLPDYRYPALDVAQIKSDPEYAYGALVGQMRHFQKRLPEQHELGIVANGAGLLIHVEHVGRAGQMIVFDGVSVDGHPSRLIQHFTQINVQMVAVEKLGDQPRRIGF